MSSIGSQYNNLSEFLAKHNAKNEKGVPATHTRIPDADLDIYGGSYIIPREELTIFHKLYYEHVFIKNKKEYLTEKQLEKDGPLLVDFDFRYKNTVEKRQHTKEHIQDMVIQYLEVLKDCYIFEKNKPFDVFIFEKPNVNRLTDVTKDGIHMMMTLAVDHTMQLVIREKMLELLPEIWDMPLVNTWDGVLDEGISKGTTNWQMYGSRKPGHEAYEITQHYIIKYDESDGEFVMDCEYIMDKDETKKPSPINQDNYITVSAQNDKLPKFEINPKIVDSYNAKKQKSPKIKRPNSKIKMNLLIEEEEEQDVGISLSEIKEFSTLKRAMDNILNSLTPSEYEIREIHQYTQVLPAKYYEPGSHLNNRLVAFALKHTDERLFLSWVMLRSKAADFDYNTIPSLRSEWLNFKEKSDGVTKRSIMYWAKQDAYDEYLRVKSETVNYYLEEAISTQTDHDIANVLYHMYKDKYACTDIKTQTWYMFDNHRWERDKGTRLRLAISKEVHQAFNKKSNEVDNDFQHYDPNDPLIDALKEKSKKIQKVMVMVKKSTDKNNIMREAAELFWDKEFMKSMDSNKYLLCFNNGVIDFKQKTFRDGYPQDYITKCTGINYIPYDDKNDHFAKMVDEIKIIMKKLFPIEELNRYMWDHLASCLIGTNRNQTFNIYNGSGSNGKSILTDLMTKSLGEYKGTVPITLITRDRGNVGSTQSELMQLKGVRYAVMQEPNKDTPLKEGILKELTGDTDAIQGRQLYSEAESFVPQFKLVVCTNVMFKITSNDDGTWRRIRKCDFMSKFIDEGEQHTDDTPYVYPKDKTLPDKLQMYAPYFMSVLVKRAFETEGIVEDCDVVLSASMKYRKGQDFISSFVNERIIKPTDRKAKGVKKTELVNEFKLWFQQEQGFSEKVPKGQDLYDYLDKVFGAHKSTGWSNIEMIYPEREDELDEISDD